MEITAVTVRERKLVEKYLFQSQVNVYSSTPLGVLLGRGAEPTQDGYTWLYTVGACTLPCHGVSLL